MKKALKTVCILFSITIVLTFCSCNGNDKITATSSTSSTLHISQNQRTLLGAITASDDLDNIGGIRVVTSSCTVGSPIISDKEDMKFLQNYTYSHYRTTKKGLEEQLLKDKTNYSFEVVTKSQSKHFLYLMQDGSIAVKKMCGDSGVTDVSYDFYTTDTQNILTKEKVDLMVQKEE